MNKKVKNGLLLFILLVLTSGFTNEKHPIDGADAVLLLRPIYIENTTLPKGKSGFESKLILLDVLKNNNNKFNKTDTINLNYNISHWTNKYGISMKRIFNIIEDYLVIIWDVNADYSSSFYAIPVGSYSHDLLDEKSKESISKFLNDNRRFTFLMEEYKGVLEDILPPSVVLYGKKAEWFKKELHTNNIYKFYSIDLLKEYLKKEQ